MCLWSGRPEGIDPEAKGNGGHKGGERVKQGAPIRAHRNTQVVEAVDREVAGAPGLLEAHLRSCSKSKPFAVEVGMGACVATHCLTCADKRCFFWAHSCLVVGAVQNVLTFWSFRTYLLSSEI
eukprot:1120281-Amphidinium_carterae.1